MAPQGLALKHEAADILLEWEHFGCPTTAGRDWTLAEIQAAIERGPHKSALEPNAIEHFAEEVANKVAKGQARVVLWDDIKANHPRHLKGPWPQFHTSPGHTAQPSTYSLHYGLQTGA